MIRLMGVAVIATPLLLTGVTGTVDLAANATSSSANTNPMLNPLAHAMVTQSFGCTWFSFENVDPSCTGGHFHSGVDLAAPLGTPVIAAHSGMAHVIRSTGGYGIHIIIESSQGLSTLYGHLSATAITESETVTGGQLIGQVGSTGNSTGPHLHFEIRHGGMPEDPNNYIKIPKLSESF